MGSRRGEGQLAGPQGRGREGGPHLGLGLGPRPGPFPPCSVCSSSPSRSDCQQRQNPSKHLNPSAHYWARCAWVDGQRSQAEVTGIAQRNWGALHPTLPHLPLCPWQLGAASGWEGLRSSLWPSFSVTLWAVPTPHRTPQPQLSDRRGDQTWVGGTWSPQAAGSGSFPGAQGGQLQP